MTELEEKIIDIIATCLGYTSDKIALESSLEDDLCMDSLDQIELCIEFERAFDITIDDEEIVSAKTVFDCVQLVFKKIPADEI